MNVYSKKNPLAIVFGRVLKKCRATPPEKTIQEIIEILDVGLTHYRMLKLKRLSPLGIQSPFSH
jgi:hypothetical protein